MDMGHVLGAGQLAVRDVEEISRSGQATEKVPGSTVGLIIGHVAAGNLEVQRNCTVLGHCEDVKQLLNSTALGGVPCASWEFGERDAELS